MRSFLIKAIIWINLLPGNEGSGFVLRIPYQADTGKEKKDGNNADHKKGCRGACVVDDLYTGVNKPDNSQNSKNRTESTF